MGLLVDVPWMRVKDVLEAIAASVVILGVPPIAARHVVRLWRGSVGRRRAQSRLLDQLACGEPMARVNTWLGLPVLTAGDTHTYELPGAWVQVTEDDGVVAAFAMTIRSRRMYHDTTRLTVGNLRVRLGRTTFGEIEKGAIIPEPAYAEGNRRVGYAQRYGFGNPGHYQAFVLAYNVAGAGDLSFSQRVDKDADDYQRTAALTGTTINTLMVYGPRETPPTPLEAFVGVEPDEMRLRVGRGRQLRVGQQ